MSSGILFLPDQTELPVGDQESVLDLANSKGVELMQSCGGMATCGTCRVLVKRGLDQLPPRNEVEADLAEDRGFLPEERLACQMPPLAGLCLEVPE